jgi:hypothetical protein
MLPRRRWGRRHQSVEGPPVVCGDRRVERLHGSFSAFDAVENRDGQVRIDPGLGRRGADSRSAEGHVEPTAGTAVATATPSSPVFGQRATIEKVLNSCMTFPSVNAEISRRMFPAALGSFGVAAADDLARSNTA